MISFDQYLSRQGFNLSRVSYNRQTISMLRLGRIDLAPQVSGSFFYRLEAMNEPAEDFLPVIRVDELSKDLWLVASKSTTPGVVHALRNAYHILKQRGDCSNSMRSTIQTALSCPDTGKHERWHLRPDNLPSSFLEQLSESLAIFCLSTITSY